MDRVVTSIRVVEQPFHEDNRVETVVVHKIAVVGHRSADTGRQLPIVSSSLPTIQRRIGAADAVTRRCTAKPPETRRTDLQLDGKAATMPAVREPPRE